MNLFENTLLAQNSFKQLVKLLEVCEMETKSPLGQRKKKSKLPMASSIILGTNFDQQRQLSRVPVSPGGSDRGGFCLPAPGYVERKSKQEIPSFSI